MTAQKLSGGVAHTLPADMRAVLSAKKPVIAIWEDITPLARNEWICWVTSAKKEETRERRMRIMLDKFTQGERRPCCWAGCTHR